MLTAERLRELLHYDPLTGVFSRNGKRVGSNRGHRYVRVYVDGRMYFAHRLAWLYMNGFWPSHGVDHEDGDGFNNRWKNLRPATQAQNLQNLHGPRGTVGRTSRHLGVCWHAQARKWRATIKVGDRARHLGLFDDEDAAAQAYLTAKRLYHEYATV